MNHSRRRFLAVAATLPVHAEPQPQLQPVRRMELVHGRYTEAVAKGLAILPLGSIEYHGPGVGLGCDSIIGEGLANRVGSRLTDATVFPTVGYTHAPPQTSAFKGTISVRPEAVTMYLEDILRGIAALGFLRVFVLNAQDGNTGPARSAV